MKNRKSSRSDKKGEKIPKGVEKEREEKHAIKEKTTLRAKVLSEKFLN